ncbi:MAG: AAA family ATPase, partial [Desulfovibrionaceae bacterium]|nr:AAA family ATPase [Desulfovibrionaceae bacterium]
MISRIVLENFMAHERTELDLGPGLTVLTGPNNSGKSAVVEGLRCLASNPAPKYFIRHGASRARVEALLDNGFRVAWVRSKTSAIYEVWAPGADGPETYAKFGRRPPGDVL